MVVKFLRVAGVRTGTATSGCRSVVVGRTAGGGAVGWTLTGALVGVGLGWTLLGLVVGITVGLGAQLPPIAGKTTLSRSAAPNLLKTP